MCGGKTYKNCEHIPKGYSGNNVFTYRIDNGKFWRGSKLYNDKPTPMSFTIRLCRKCNAIFLKAMR
jgi:hypothetical protein